MQAEEGAALRVVLADDHPIYREGVARTLSEAGFEILGQAADGEGAVLLTRDHRPDLVLLDISMPRGGGHRALAEIMALADPPKIVMLTASEDEDDLMRALKGGAQGYVLKGVGAGDLVSILNEVAQGRTHVAPGLAGRILTSLRVTSGAREAAQNPLSDLSRREEDILRLVARGMSNREVGETLDLQEKTVKHYMTSILQKLHLRNRVEAAMLAREHLKP